MKIVICTTPIRPVPTAFPPFGSMSIIHSLRQVGYDPYFYDIDGLRPSIEEVEAFFLKQQPDVLGISAVVSTAYAYTKKLVRLVKKVSPKTRIVLGGNLAASAEILHRLAGVDICVIGEGEIISSNLFPALEKMIGKPLDCAALEEIRGITYIRPDGEMAFAGYETRLPPEEVFKPDFKLLEKYSNIDNYIFDAAQRPDLSQDPRFTELHRAGKRAAVLLTEKGCVARCTFCHRWDKGYRSIPVDQIIDHMKHMMKTYNVGLFSFGDENFGSDKRHLEEFLVKVKPLDVLWSSSMRVKSITPDLLKRMKDAGCVAMFYGMESGSPKILEIMEKKAGLEDNIKAARWTREAGIFTIFQMILGMPGEDEKTIAETTEFLKAVTQDYYTSPRSLMSLNYIQALPGTAVYEYARHKGLIGTSLQDEEAYLIKISDIDAADDTKMPNYTDYDNLTLRSWRRRIVMDVMKHYHVHNKTPIPSFPAFLWRLVTNRITDTGTHFNSGLNSEEKKRRMVAEYDKGGYFNLQRDLSYDVIVAYFYPLRNIVLGAWLIQNDFRKSTFPTFLGHLRDWVRCRLSPSKSGEIEAESLRALMARLTPPQLTPTARSMQYLREGR